MQSLETKPVRAANATRKGRPDSMAHFPFADQEGTVPEVLKGGYAAKPSLLEMGIPGRKRFVEKVFEEMRFDLGGIRLSDLPEALDVSWHAYPSIAFRQLRASLVQTIVA